MPVEVTRQDVQRMVADGAQLVEVLDAQQYRRAHLPGAINIPLGELDQESSGQLEPIWPVIVYCYDYQ